MNIFKRIKGAFENLIGALGGGGKKEPPPEPPKPPPPEPPKPPPPPEPEREPYKAPGWESRYAPEVPEEEEERLVYWDRFLGRFVEVVKEDESAYDKSDLRIAHSSLGEAAYYVKRIPVPCHIFINSDGMFQIAIDYTKVTYRKRKDTRRKRHRKDVRKSYKYR